MNRLIMNLALVLITGLFVSACDPLKGRLEVVKEFNGIVTDSSCVPGRGGGCQPEKNVKIPVGNHETSINFRSKREVLLTVKVGNKSQAMILAVPKNKALPEYKGEFMLTAQESKQPFDLSGAVDTQERSTNPQREIESCTYTTQVWACYFDRGLKREVCNWVSQTHYGRHEVEFYYHHTDKFMVAHLLAAGSQEQLAHFSGEHHKTDKVYTYQGICR